MTSKSQESRTVLIIDDNPDDLEFFVRMLKNAPSDTEYTVLTAYRSEKGLELFRNNKVDCVFLDFSMPGDDGLVTIEKLRTFYQHKQLPVVILTGEPNQKVQANAARLGAMDYVVKDSIETAEQLEQVVSKVIDWVDYLN